MKKLKIIDKIIKEPIGGAHSNREKAFEIVTKSILSEFEDLKKLSPEDLVEKRMKKFIDIGVYSE
jgi:acetyl-CoA carboxylase carboxyl transferase subunit alpha